MDFNSWIDWGFELANRDISMIGLVCLIVSACLNLSLQWRELDFASLLTSQKEEGGAQDHHHGWQKASEYPEENRCQFDSGDRGGQHL